MKINKYKKLINYKKNYKNDRILIHNKLFKMIKILI